jgi:lysophospholipase L1-like esterase
MDNDRRRRIKLFLLKAGYVAIVVLMGVGLLEGAARLIGLGDPVLYYSDAWGGLRPLPDQRVKRLGGATVTVDGNGFRTPVAEKPGALRILFLGDSVTYGGSRIDDTELYTEVAADVIRSQGRAVYAMNAGVNGTSLRNHAERFEKQGERLDVLVWLFPWGDTLRNFATGGQISPPRYKPKLALVELVDYCITRYWVRFLRKDPPRAAEFVRPESPAGREEFFNGVLAERVRRNLNAVREAVAEARRRGVPVVMGVTPYREGNELEPLPPEATEFLDEMAEMGVIVFDAFAVFADAADNIEDCFIDQVHLNARGHELIGKALGEILQNVIPAAETSR